MLDHKPFNSILLDASFQNACLKHNEINVSETDHAIQDISVVGMLLPDTKRVRQSIVTVDDLWYDDLSMVSKTLISFSEAGIPVHRHVRLNVYNLLPPVQSDFLQNALSGVVKNIKPIETDVVILNQVPYYGYTPDCYRDYFVHEGFSELSYAQFLAPHGNGKLVSVSRFHREEGIWPTAAFNMKAKFIVTHGGTHDEVSTEQMKDHEDSVLLCCSKTMEDLNRKNGNYSDIMGVVANANFLEKYRSCTNSETKLGAAIKRAPSLKK